MVKNLPTDAGDAGDEGSIPGSGRSPGRGNGNPLQYSCAVAILFFLEFSFHFFFYTRDSVIFPIVNHVLLPREVLL